MKFENESEREFPVRISPSVATPLALSLLCTFGTALSKFGSGYVFDRVRYSVYYMQTPALIFKNFGLQINRKCKIFPVYVIKAYGQTGSLSLKTVNVGTKRNQLHDPDTLTLVKCPPYQLNGRIIGLLPLPHPFEETSCFCPRR